MINNKCFANWIVEREGEKELIDFQCKISGGKNIILSSILQQNEVLKLQRLWKARVTYPTKCKSSVFATNAREQK